MSKAFVVGGLIELKLRYHDVRELIGQTKREIDVRR